MTSAADDSPEAVTLPQRHRGARAVERLVELAPATGGLALWIHHQDLPDPADPRPIASDGHTIYYGAAFTAHAPAEQLGLVAHAILHVALRHPQRLADLRGQLGDVDPELFNLCADAIVNSTLSHLSWIALPHGAVHLDQLLGQVLHRREDLDKALLEWDLERLYRAIDDRPPPMLRLRGSEGATAGGMTERPVTGPADAPAPDAPPAPVRGDGPRSSRARRLGHPLVPDLLPATRQDPQDSTQLAHDWHERLLRAHANDGEHSLLRALIADVQQSRTPWELVLRTRLTRSLARRADLSWSRPARSYLANRGRLGPDRRMPWEPGRTAAKAVPRLALIVDVSGSIETALLRRFAREIDAITRRLEARILLVVGDRQVTRIELLEPGRTRLEEMQLRGGGGTDFAPLLRAADGYHPDLGVVLTDLQGPADFRPAWPVIWAVPAAHAQAEPPFGRKLVLR